VLLQELLRHLQKVILLDEPFVRLDIRLREKVRDEVLHLLKVSGTTAIIVTHEAEEAMFMSDRIVVINDGRLKQIGRPSDLYNRPKSKFVAEFFGEVNLISGTIKNGKVDTLLGTFDSNGFDEGTSVNLIIRHEGIKLIDHNNDKIARAKVLETRLLGRFSLIHLQVEKGKSKVHLHARVPGLSYLKPRSIIGIEIDSVQSYIFPK
jgi:ABC-type spermidine/putrescine transport systems, ATPase components